MFFPRFLFVILLSSPVSVLAFPEIPFCPIGGPPGWFNRMSGDYRYYPVQSSWYPPSNQQYYPYRPIYASPPWQYDERWQVPAPVYQRKPNL